MDLTTINPTIIRAVQRDIANKISPEGIFSRIISADSTLCDPEMVTARLQRRDFPDFLKGRDFYDGVLFKRQGDNLPRLILGYRSRSNTSFSFTINSTRYPLVALYRGSAPLPSEPDFYLLEGALTSFPFRNLIYDPVRRNFNISYLLAILEIREDHLPNDILVALKKTFLTEPVGSDIFEWSTTTLNRIQNANIRTLQDLVGRPIKDLNFSKMIKTEINKSLAGLGLKLGMTSEELAQWTPR